MRVPGVRSARLQWVVGALVLCVLAADSAVLAAREVPPLGVPYSVALEQHLVEEHPAAKAERERLREDAILALFQRRADAVLARDKAAFLATLDDTDEEFVRRQGQVFDSLGLLDFASWRYRMRDETYSLSSIDWERYDDFDDVVLPVLTLHYQLKGFDKRPVIRRLVYTVVRDGDEWLIANDRDLQDTTTSGTSARRDPWENGPIVVKKSANGIVIGHPEDADAIDSIQKEIESAVKHVSSHVGKAWGEKTVVILPANDEELQYLLENPQADFEFAAVARAEFTSLSEDLLGQYAGARVVINPDNFDAGSDFNTLLIRHEITHVAMFERTGPLTPRWLVEGIAEWVANDGASYPTTRLAGAMADLVEDEGVPQHLPLDSDFGLIDDAGVGYNAGWLLCRYIAQRYGAKALLRFYDRMGDRTGLDKPGDKLDTVLRSVLKTNEAALLKAWRPYVQAAVGDVSELVAAPKGPYKADGVSRASSGELAEDWDVDVKAIDDAGFERAVQGGWYQGPAPREATRLVTNVVVVARDEAGARRIAELAQREYRKYDSGTPIPNGRLYLLGYENYVGAIAVVTTGITTYEVTVLYRQYTGDPRPDARALAAAQLKALTTVP